MDVTALAAFLAPYVGFLLNAGTSVAEGAADKLAGKLGAHAKALWDRLWPAVEAEPAAAAAAHVVAVAPDSEMATTELGRRLEELLKADPALAADVERLWADAQPTIAASGDSTVRARDITDSTVIAGHGNVVRGPGP